MVIFKNCLVDKMLLSQERKRGEEKKKRPLAKSEWKGLLTKDMKEKKLIAEEAKSHSDLDIFASLVDKSVLPTCQ